LSNKKGVVLLELVVVIVIVAILYTLSIAIFPNKVDYSDEKNFNLKKILLQLTDNQYRDMRLICFKDKDEDSCIVELEGREMAKELKLPYKAKFHRYWQDGSEREDEFEDLEVLYEREVKFVYQIFSNGSSSAGVLEAEDRFITYFSFFDDFSVFEDEDDAKEHLIKEDLKKAL